MPTNFTDNLQTLNLSCHWQANTSKTKLGRPKMSKKTLVNYNCIELCVLVVGGISNGKLCISACPIIIHTEGLNRILSLLVATAAAAAVWF